MLTGLHAGSRRVVNPSIGTQSRENYTQEHDHDLNQTKNLFRASFETKDAVIQQVVSATVQTSFVSNQEMIILR